MGVDVLGVNVMALIQYEYPHIQLCKRIIFFLSFTFVLLLFSPMLINCLLQKEKTQRYRTGTPGSKVRRATDCATRSGQADLPGRAA